MRLHQPSVLPEFFFFTDEARSPDPMAAVRCLPPGSGVVFRHYSLANREFLARALARIAKQKRLLFLLAGDWKMAARVGAAGVHWPEGMARFAVGVRSRKNWLVTVAAHSPAALNRARAIKAQAAFLSPVFATPSHPEAKPLGPIRFALMSQKVRLKVLALGGVNKISSRRLGSADGFATAGNYFNAPRPSRRRELVREE
jgi:thiamine-phosphate pyrophosphorylase